MWMQFGIKQKKDQIGSVQWSVHIVKRRLHN